MNKIISANPVSAGLKIFQNPPEINIYDDVLYIPRIPGPHDSNYGIYDSYGRLVQTAGPRRGWPNFSLGQSPSSSISPSSSYPRATENSYFYGGHIGTHFGHFLTETLPRFWCAPHWYLNKKIICHSGDTIEKLFSVSWIKEIFEMIGLVKEQFIIFDRPTTITSLLISGVSFEENHFSHRQFAEFCNRLGRKYAIDLGISDPIFLSREKFKSAMRTIEGEEEITSILRNRGFRIVYPETLSIREQMGLFSSDRLTSGFVGSAFHNSIFCSSPRGLALCYGNSYSTNFWLMDQVNDANIQYFSTPTLILKNSPGAGVPAEFTIDNPMDVANLVIDYYEDKIVLKEENNKDNYSKKEGPYLIKTKFDSFLQIDRQLGKIHAGSGVGPRIHKIFAYIYDSKWIELSTAGGDVLSMDQLDSVSNTLNFKMQTSQNEKTFSLKHPVTSRFVSTTPDGVVECNREYARAWEQFFLISTNQD